MHLAKKYRNLWRRGRTEQSWLKIELPTLHFMAQIFGHVETSLRDIVKLTTIKFCHAELSESKDLHSGSFTTQLSIKDRKKQLRDLEERPSLWERNLRAERQEGKTQMAEIEEARNEVTEREKFCAELDKSLETRSQLKRTQKGVTDTVRNSVDEGFLGYSNHLISREGSRK